MRKIKFRGKTACCQLATAEDVWVYGGVHSIFENDDTCYISVNNYFEKNKSEKLLVKKETVGQYTGLHDKNGKEIYEGDIVKINDEIITQVIWDKDYLGYFLYANEENSIEYFENGEQPLYDYWESIEVIGNIHDNKELLDTEQEES